MSISYTSHFGQTNRFSGSVPARLGNTLYVIETLDRYTHFSSGLFQYDITDPYNPNLISSIDITTMALPFDLKIKGGYLYASDFYGNNGTQPVGIFDLSTSPPTNVGGISYLLGQCSSLAIKDNYLFVGGYHDVSYGIVVFDISNPLTPVYVNHFSVHNTPLVSFKISVVGSFLYSVNVGHELSITDISDPYNPIVTGITTTNIGSATDVLVNDNYAYVRDQIGYPTAYQIFDVSNPYSPFWVSTIPEETSGWATIQDNIIYMGGFNKPILYNISDPLQPKKIGYGNALLSGNYGGIAVFGEYFSISCGTGCYGNYIYRYEPESSSSVSESSFSSSSYSSSSKSSSSSSFEATKVLNSVLIEQGHHNLLPFYFIAERGISADPSTLEFSLRTSTNQYFDYSAVLPSTALTNTNSVGITDTYVPQEDETKYKHDAITYVDIIANDAKGIKKVNVRNETDLYDMDDPSYSFIIPKFTWDNTLFKANVSANSVSTIYTDTMWVGAGDKNIYRVGYNSNGASITYTANTTAEAYSLVFEEGNYLFVTDYDYMSRFLINSYLATKSKVVIETDQDVSIPNDLNDIISYYDHENGKVYSVESYSGKLRVRNPNTLTVMETYTGLDAPFKVIKSGYHNSYFVAGTNILWKLSGNTIKEAYRVGGYRIKDISCSESGEVCILLDGSSRDIIRILGKNLYDIVFNEYITDGVVRYCDYCGQGIFYVLVESNSNTNATEDLAYTANHYLFNVKDKTFKAAASLSAIVTTTTTTTPKQTTNKVEVESPNGGEQIELGSTYEIKWTSSESVKDVVKIELYKEEELYDTIVSETPNTGIYRWDVPASLGEGNQFKIKITWLTASSNPSNYDFSNNVFTLAKEVTTTTTTTTAITLNEAVGIDYEPVGNRIVILLRNGLMGYLDISKKVFYGMFDTGLTNSLCMVAHNDLVKEYSDITKVRVFVGTEPYLNNMWDSGIIETSLNSIFYGGGNNLVPGERYYVNIQVYSETYGWSELQTKTWIMPR